MIRYQCISINLHSVRFRIRIRDMVRVGRVSVRVL